MKISIADLKLKREREKNIASPRKPHQEKRGLITRVCEEMLINGTRKYKRMQAKVFLKDPLKYNSENFGRSLTARGRLI